MRLHDYLEQIIGNKIAISILRALVRYKGKIYTVRGLAQDAGASHPEVSKTLEELEKFGIVKIQPVGRAYRISLNEKSYVLSKIVKPVLKAEEQTLDEVISILKNHLNTNKIISAVIFGSVAKREERDDSDIDVLIISDDVDHAISAITNASREISSKFQSIVSPIVFSKSQLRTKKKGNPLIQSILDAHILICGKELVDISK